MSAPRTGSAAFAWLSPETVSVLPPLPLPDPPPGNARGERVLAAGRGQAPGPAPDFSLVLATDLGRVLLVRNALRQELELPGGWRDRGENGRQAAARELLEETGYVAASLEPLAWLQLASPARAAPLRGQLYQAHVLRRRHGHAPDPEIESLHWVRLPALPPAVAAIDAWLVRCFAP